MSTVKWLEKKPVIQFFGLGLFLSPFVNFLFMFSILQKKMGVPWSQLPYRQIFSQGQPIKYLLAFGCLVIGIVMLRGSQKAWHYVMGLLTGFILNQIPTIGQDIRGNWLWGPVFLMNVGLLYFIADQLVFKNSEFSFKRKPSPENPLSSGPVQPPVLIRSLGSPMKPNRDIKPSTGSVKTITTQPQLKTQLESKRESRSRRNSKKPYDLEFMSEGVVGAIYNLDSVGFKLRLKKPVQRSLNQRIVEVSFDKVHYKKAKIHQVFNDSISFQFIAP